VVLRTRSTDLIGSVVGGLVDGLLLLLTIMFMSSALVVAFGNHFLELGLLMSVVAFGLVAVLGLSVRAAARAQVDRGLSVANFCRVAAKLLLPLIACTAASVGAWGVAVVVTGSIF
jgi:hypothetical protein